MSNGRTTILIVEDEAAHAEAISRALWSKEDRVRILVVATLAEYRQTIVADPPDIVLMDINLPDGCAIDVLNASEAERAFPLLVMTAYGNEGLAVEAMKAGAFDYLVKSTEGFARMPQTVHSALREWKLRQDHQQIESALHESEERFRTLLQKVPTIACQGYAMDGTVHYWNHASERFYGYTAAEAIGRNILELIIPPAMRTEVKSAMETMVATGQGPPPSEMCLRHKEGREVEVYSSYVILQKPGRDPELFCLDVDITARKNYERQLEHLSTHDDLTGLANRALLFDRLAQSLHYAHRSRRLVAVLLVDLDRFKVINDSLGHDFGDQVLCAVAQRLLQNVREADTVARMGGDEFVVLLAEVADAEDVGLVARKILDNLSRPYQVGHREIIITASLGISLYPKDSDNGAMLIRNADIAMYRSKRDDRSNFCFYAAEMNKHIQETMELEGELRHALERKEFCLHYQPKIDLLNGRIIGSEALVRWHHPQRGMVSPADFIPLAEETGLIVPLGAWVMKEACQQARVWQEMGLPALGVAVNLSARQFRRGDLPQVVREILQETGLEPCLLELELTESMVMDDPAGAEETMRALKEMGVRLSLDDFGTGYSSLNYLRSFPVDSLKIDRSFINDVATDPSGASVVASIIDIAHNLGLTAVAEGVETLEQLKFLSGCDCNMFQGYLFSKPLPAGEFAALLRSGRQMTIDA
ncbi:MAG: two-component system response regulator [Deltaproteobacteria bacterium HGW-Deltaproteobacteria-4]|nr:MAG: two-component system response regulator [Deltaproteobacteria bacterium HGW-Deltaproteobacteria-4]